MVLALGAIFTFVYIRKALARSCWTWRGRLGGGPCNQWTKPGEEEEFWWGRHKTGDPEVEVPIAIPDFALEYGTWRVTERFFSQATITDWISSTFCIFA